MNDALIQSMSCPACQKRFTYREREAPLEGDHLPVTLNCGHKLCFSCLRTATNRSAGVNNGLPVDDIEDRTFRCSVCQQEQPQSSGEALVQTFPLDVYTIGLLATLDGFGVAYLSYLAAPLQPEPLSLRSDVAVAFEKQVITRERNALEKINSCNMCASSVVDWLCTVCSSSFCYLCTTKHKQTCTATSLDFIPYDSNGNLMAVVPKSTVAQHDCTWSCLDHYSHHQHFQCAELTRRNEQTKASLDDGNTQFLECQSLLFQIEELIVATVMSTKDLRAAEKESVLLYDIDRACLMGFFGRLQSSATAAENRLVQKQMELDGKRLTLLRSFSGSFSRQISHLKFLRTRWDTIVGDYVCLGMDLRREQKSFEEELLSCALWDPDQLLSKRLKIDRIVDAVWEKGIPKGLRSCLAKCRLELSVSDDKLLQSLDAAPLSSFVTRTQQCGQTVYEFTVPPVDLTSLAVGTISSTASTLDELLNVVYHVDRLVPRTWFPQYAAQIDGSPSLCVVTHIENPPAAFWIRVNSRLMEFQTLTASVQEYCQDGAVAGTEQDISVGDIYAAKMKGFKAGLWNCGRMRVRVLGKEETVRGTVRYSCHVIDLGNRMSFRATGLRMLPRHIQQADPCARPARLSGFTPYYNGEMGRWSPQATEHMNKWLSHVGTPFVILEDIEDDRLLVVDLFSDCGVQSLKEFLMFAHEGTLCALSEAFEIHREGRRAIMKQ